MSVLTSRGPARARAPARAPLAPARAPPAPAPARARGRAPRARARAPCRARRAGPCSCNDAYYLFMSLQSVLIIII